MQDLLGEVPPQHRTKYMEDTDDDDNDHDLRQETNSNDETTGKQDESTHSSST